jgi:hypothetical protein
MKLRWKNLYILLSVGIASVLALPAGAQSECPVDPELGGECWTTEDVLDDRIDNHAQSAMMRMFARGGEAAEDASAMLCAVKTRELEGIVVSNHRWPALRAQEANSRYWHIIPQGAQSECYKEPAERPPLIVFREQIQDDRDGLGESLSDTWKNRCGIPPTEPRCYTPTISRPEDPEEVECDQPYNCDPTWDREKILEECSGYATRMGSRATGECIEDPEIGCSFCGLTTPPHRPDCTGPNDCIVGLGYPETCRDGSECLVLAGNEGLDFSCGVCASTNTEHRDCLERARAQYRKEHEVCFDEEKENAIKCVQKFLQCGGTLLAGAAKEAVKQCLKAAGCFVGGPSIERYKCGAKAMGKQQRALEECRQKHLKQT